MMTKIEGIVPSLGQALEKRGYETLTPVQNAVLALDPIDADALVSAQTGSGKTVAFGLALAPTLLEGENQFDRARLPLALVVAPTRELALQVKRELEWLYEMTRASVVSCVGGMDMRDERRGLSRGAHIVVGTPGRLRDHIERGSLDLSGLKAVVLDEADEMLDLGFRDDLEFILDAAPDTRRTLMFSATVSRPISTMAKRYQRDAVRISTKAEESQHIDIEYRALVVAPNDRENAIINVLRYFEATNALVFCSTRAMVNHMTSRFNNRGLSVVALSGELSQKERSHALQAMRDGRAQVCIATDVAARGLDLPNLDLVIHADMPRNKESLLHRSGRTGRAGRKGVSALIVPHNWRKRTERLLQSARIEAEWGHPPSVKQIMTRDRERILEDPGLSEPISEEEQVFAEALLERHNPLQIAAALMRKHLAGLGAPEELLEGGKSEGKPRKHDDFKDGVWVSLSVGREDNAQPRWLLPLLCRAGHITKNEIGSIRIQNKETHVQLLSGCVDQFLEAVGPSGKIDKTIDVSRLQGAPGGGGGGGGGAKGGKPEFKKRKPKPSRESQDRSREEKRSTLQLKPGDDVIADAKAAMDQKAERAEQRKQKRLEARSEDAGKSDDYAPRGKPGKPDKKKFKKADGQKPHQRKLAKAGKFPAAGKSGAARKGGEQGGGRGGSPLKRKTAR